MRVLVYTDCCVFVWFGSLNKIDKMENVFLRLTLNTRTHTHTVHSTHIDDG